MSKYSAAAVIASCVLLILACLPTPSPTDTPAPTETATRTPTPVVVVVTATPAPTPTVDLEEDLILAPASYWMDLEIQGQFPGAEIWPPVGVERGVRLYRMFGYQGKYYVAVFRPGKEKWELGDAIEISITPALESGRSWPEGEAAR